MDASQFQTFSEIFEKSLNLFSKDTSNDFYKKIWTSKNSDTQSSSISQKQILNVNSCVEKFENIQTYRDLKIEFLKTPLISDLEVNSIDWMDQFLKTYFHLSQKIIFDAENFETCCDILNRHISEKFYKKLYLFTPLYNFDTEHSWIEIENIKIEKITPAKFDRISGIDLHRGDNDPSILYPIKKLNYILSLSAENDASFDPEEISSNFLHALRLTSSGSVKFGNWYGYSPLGWQADYLPGHVESEMVIGNPYLLKKDDVQSFKEKFQLLEHLKSNFKLEKIRYLEYSIRRFNYIYRKSKVEDDITDLMISLETMLNNQPYEVTDKTSLRAAMILEENDDQKENCQRFIKKCYSIRSEIVHGKARKEKIKEINKNLSDNDLKEILSIEKIIQLLNNDEINQIKNRELLNILSRKEIKEHVPSKFQKELTDDEIKEKLETYVRKAIFHVLKLQTKYDTQDNMLQKIDSFTLDRNKNLFE